MDCAKKVSFFVIVFVGLVYLFAVKAVHEKHKHTSLVPSYWLPGQLTQPRTDPSKHIIYEDSLRPESAGFVLTGERSSRYALTELDEPLPTLKLSLYEHKKHNPQPKCDAFSFNVSLWEPILLCNRTLDQTKETKFRGQQRSLSSPTSSIQCYHSDFQDATLCEVENLIFKPDRVKCRFGDASAPRYDSIPEYERGAFQVAGCHLDTKKITSSVFPYHQKSEMTSFVALSLISSASADPFGMCTHWESRWTFFVTRYEYDNLYHQATEWFNIFYSLQFLGVAPTDEIVIVFLDGHPSHPLDSVWVRMLRAAEVRQWSSYSQDTCFRRAVFVPPGPASSLSMDYRKYTPCVAIPAVQHFAKSWLSNMEVPDVNKANYARVTLVTQDSSPMPHDKKQGPILREFSNEEEIEAVLNSSVNYRLTKVSFANLSFDEQLQVVANTDILIAPHSSSLTTIFALQPGAALLELFPAGRSGERYFNNICAWLGWIYCAELPGSSENSQHKFSVDADKIRHKVDVIFRTIANYHPDWPPGIFRDDEIDRVIRDEMSDLTGIDTGDRNIQRR